MVLVINVAPSLGVSAHSGILLHSAMLVGDLAVLAELEDRSEFGSLLDLAALPVSGSMWPSGLTGQSCLLRLSLGFSSLGYLAVFGLSAVFWAHPVSVFGCLP